MANSKAPSIREWKLGPAAFVATAFLATILNALTTRQLNTRLQLPEYRDLLLILASFTAVSLLATCSQLILAMALSMGKRVRFPLVAGLSCATAVVIFWFAFISIDGPSHFRRDTAAMLGMATVGSLLPVLQIARLLVARRWIRISVVLASASVVRAIAWAPDSWSNSQNKLLLGLGISQWVSAVVALALSRGQGRLSDHRRTDLNRLSLVGLCGLVGLVAMSLWVRRSAIAGDAESYVVGMFAGRSILFAALVVAYIYVPEFIQIRHWSLGIRKKIRRAWVLTIAVTAMSMVVGLAGISELAEALVGGQWSPNTSVIAVVVAGWAIISVTLIPFIYLVCTGSRISWAVVPAVATILVGQLAASNETTLAVFFLASSIIFAVGVCVPVLARQREVIRPILLQSSSNRTSAIDDGLTVVIPSYNPGPTVLETANAVRDAFVGMREVSVVVVSDGSTDVSVALLDAFRADWFSHVKLDRNRGKGAALLAGFGRSNTTYTAFIDADGDIPPRLLVQMVETMNTQQADVVFGSKWHPDSRLDVSRRRWLLSKLHHFIQVVLFNIDIDDTQAGIKVYRTEVLNAVRPLLKEEGFSLDLEIFVAFAAVGKSTFVESPLIIERQGPSTIRLKHVVKSFVDMLGIFWRARIGLEYQRAAVDAGQ